MEERDEMSKGNRKEMKRGMGQAINGGSHIESIFFPPSLFACLPGPAYPFI